MIALRKSSFLLIAILFIWSGCISVSIKSKGSGSRSTKYSYHDPQAPFEKVTSEQTDLAWQSSKTGNTIAVLSECNDNKDLGLQTIEGETIQALANYQILKSENLKFEDRDAIRSLVEGEVDGISVKMTVVTFKKNSCAYTLTYLGRSHGFEKDFSVYETFLRGFHAQ